MAKLKRLLLSLTACAMLCGTALGVGVEQIQVSLPRVDVYVHTEGEDLSGLTADDVTATLNGNPLQVEGFAPSDQGIFYTFMLDISKSIPAAYLDAAKQAVREVCAGLREQDKLALISFGSAVTVLSGGDSPVEEVLAQLDALACTDNHTMFYNAMDTLVEIATRETDMRRVAVVMSDGIDDTDAGMSREELENVLQQSGIAVYALCIDRASNANMELFRQFIRLSGGELYAFGPDNAPAQLHELLNRLDSVWMLQLLSSVEMETPDSVPLVIDFGDIARVSTELEPDYWAADETPPYVTGVDCDLAALSVTVRFSEPVSGADDAACYTAADGEEQPLELASVTYVGADRRAVRLVLPGLKNAGVWSFAVAGPVDLSEQKNPLIPYRATLGEEAAASEPEPQETSDLQDQLARELRNLILSMVGVVALVVLLICLIIRGHGQQKKTPPTALPAQRAAKWKPHAADKSENGESKKMKKDPSGVRFQFKDPVAPPAETSAEPKDPQ